jgi:hypothetical protein
MPSRKLRATVQPPAAFQRGLGVLKHHAQNDRARDYRVCLSHIRLLLLIVADD